MSAHSSEEEVTMENNMEDMSSRTSSAGLKNLQQPSADSTNTKKSLKHILSFSISYKYVIEITLRSISGTLVYFYAIK